jgi:hypothetical protein
MKIPKDSKAMAEQIEKIFSGKLLLKEIALFSGALAIPF